MYQREEYRRVLSDRPNFGIKEDTMTIYCEFVEINKTGEFIRSTPKTKSWKNACRALATRIFYFEPSDFGEKSSGWIERRRMTKLLIAVKSCQQDLARGFHDVIRETWGRDAKSVGY